LTLLIARKDPRWHPADLAFGPCLSHHRGRR
jgi:hypothetical protein